MHFSLSFVSSVDTGSPQGGTIGEFLEHIEVAAHGGHLLILLFRKAYTAKEITSRAFMNPLIIHDQERLGIRQALYKSKSCCIKVKTVHIVELDRTFLYPYCCIAFHNPYVVLTSLSCLER